MTDIDKERYDFYNLPENREITGPAYQIIYTKCPYCKSENRVSVVQRDYLAWRKDTLIGEAFPYLNSDQREMLMTGICPKCFINVFGEDDD